MVVALPFMIPVMIILKLTGEHYVFYRQARVGQHGKSFRMYKFSTMLLKSPELLSGDITLRKDPRVLPFGRFLRITKINEIPQLINVFKGDMSLVGPRPMPPANFSFYTPGAQAMILKLQPGMTGVGTIIFREEEEMLASSPLGPEETHRQWMSPHKARLEEWYLNNRSLWVDLKILFLTLWVIPFKDSALPYRVLKGLPEFPGELRKAAGNGRGN
jgi:lipopolysaccharide/colanic/teichoic acid biosynthesis glycosyltransferase